MIDLKETKNKIIKKENVYFLLIIFTIFVLDRYSKIQIIQDFSDKVFYLNNYINLDLMWNTGIGFGLLSSDSDLFYNIISALIAIVIFFLIIFALKSDKFDKISFSQLLEAPWEIFTIGSFLMKFQIL